MGKGNRVRLAKAQQAAENQSVFTAKKQKKQTPAWVGTLAVVLVIVLLLACVALSVISEGGYLLRWKKVAESENYSVSGTMLSYFFYQNYSTFLNQYSSIVSYMGLDTSMSLKNQTAMGAEDGETWFDYFMNPTIEEVETMLVYCEEAKTRGIKLEDEDYEAIDEAIAAMEEAAAEYGYTTAGYITAMYGTGVKKQDVRAALELSQLAYKCSTQLSEEVNAAITEDEINTYYDENPGTFLTADVLTYSFSATEGDDADAYAADKAEAKKFADELAACKTVDEFKNYVMNYLAGDEFDSLYEEHAEELDAALLPDEAALAARRQQIIDACIANALEGKTVEETTSEDAVEVMFSEIEAELTDSLTESLQLMDYSGYAWSDTEGDDAGLWISDEARKAGDTTVIEEDVSSDEEDEESAATYTATVYMIVDPMSRDEQPSRNVGHILFTADTYTTDTGAEAKAEEIMAQFKAGTMSKETFEALAEEYTEDNGVFYENVVPGQMVTEFEDWLFDDARVAGDVDIVNTQYGYHIMYYLGADEAMPVWKVTAKSGVANEKIEAWYEESAEKYAVTVNDAAVNKVNA
ncbi:MAG: peptidylprolyl isomerase [Clostridia bacterium]|nr:peptidylprolyl isomerase [Clostridia bacterium]